MLLSIQCCHRFKTKHLFKICKSSYITIQVRVLRLCKWIFIDYCTEGFYNVKETNEKYSANFKNIQIFSYVQIFISAQIFCNIIISFCHEFLSF